MRFLTVATVVVAALLVVVVRGQGDWNAVDQALQTAISPDKTFPGCVAIVGDAGGILYAKAFGSFTYGLAPPFSGGVNPPMTLSTQFDMASCTKVVATNTAVALLYQWGYLSDLDLVVCDDYLLGAAFAQNSKNTITIRNLLLHNAGFPPDPVPWYWQQSFGCPQSNFPEPAMDFSCRTQIYESIFTQTLDRPPNTEYVYSDLSFITLAYIVGKIAYTQGLVQPSQYLPGCLAGENNHAAHYSCSYETFVRLSVFGTLGMSNSGFLPPQVEWGNCAPAENETAYPQYQNKCMQGQVSDGNAYAMGGIAGHAGLFSTAPDIAKYMHAYMFGGSDPIPESEASELLFPSDAHRRAFGGGDLLSTTPFLNSTTVKYWIREYNQTQSSRALGWNTNDPLAKNDQGWNLSCGAMSPQTFMHTGYTGTEVCGDPINQFYTVLLTNRVYPTDAPGSTAVHAARQAFNTAALHAVLADRQYKAEGHNKKSEAVGKSENKDPVIPFVYPLYKQCNSSWGDDLMQTETICAVGCLMSSVSMALAGHGVSIPAPGGSGAPPQLSDPATLNVWLQQNSGYAGDNDLDETKVPGINPERIRWIGFYYNNTSLPPATIKQMLDNELIVIANVDNGGHFVLVTGYDQNDDTTWYVNDPGFDRQSYTYDQIVGYRLFDIL